MWCWMTAYSIRKNSSTLVMAEWGHSDIVSGLCECKAGTNCGPCKHKDTISKFLKIAKFSCRYHYITEGIVCNIAWYRDLEKHDQVTDVNTVVENRNSNVIEEMNHDALEVVNDLELSVIMGGETSD